ncbi:histidine kinase N-terminal 7TM domain-containing protein [Roseicyclus persicicus]|uniref:histidine kinase n=1 Tax=Roseicyclus persicicus TaxID=2650661 RepID=A0A7X6JW52_9RHOB|nr:histidine kinase N-terminal 7TM domain-containing protein [Roseibacterium persicicum]NKX43992.1 ATPase [Roseibacterium persicicum]
MTCLNDLTADPLFFVASAVSLLAALVMVWTVRTQSFHGKFFFALTFVGVIWTLMSVGFEAASAGQACQVGWAITAWLGNALVPIAWCFFVFSYLGNGAWPHARKARRAVVSIPVAVLALAVANPWHNLLYLDTTTIPAGSDRVDFDHGPVFYAIIVMLYGFVLATLSRLAGAFRQATRSAWGLLATLVAVAVSPLVANALYIGLGVTVFGADPTAYLFTLGVLFFTQLLVSNKTIDMASVGKSILFDTMSEPVILIDRQRRVVLMNMAARRSALVDGNGALLSELIPSINLPVQSGCANQVAIGSRVYEPRSAGIENPLDPAGPVLGWSVTFIDITDRIAASAALEEALKRADDANREKDEFIAVVSHEMRTPLTSLKGGLALALSGRLGELSDQVRSSLEIAHRSGVRLSRLVDDILLAQKLDLGALSLESQRVDLARALEESIEENRPFAAARGVRLATTRVDRPSIVVGDAFAMRQIIDNLVSNAIKFSHENGLVECTLRRSDGRLRLSIRDTGRGIPDSKKDQVFGRFRQLANGMEGSSQGSGLGLHIARQLARQMDGDVFFESTEGVGTTFHLEFSHVIDLEAVPPRLVG